MNHPSFGRVSRAYTLALTATSATTASPVPFGIKVARIVSSVDCWFQYGAAPQVSSVGGGTFLPAGYVEILAVDTNDVFSAIPDSATTGNLNVSEITR